MIIIAVKAVPADSKPPAVVSGPISTGGRCGSGTSVFLSTRASSLHIRRAEGLVLLPKLVELIGPSTVLAEEISPCFSSSTAAPSMRLRVFLAVFHLQFLVCPSPRVEDAALALQRFCQPEHHPYISGELEVWFFCRSWSNSSDHPRSWQKRYPRAFHHLQQRLPCACEYFWLFLRLPPWRDVAAELQSC